MKPIPKTSIDNLVIVTHKFVTHPDDELVNFLNQKNKSNVLHICHSFYEAPDRKSYFRWYKRGKLIKKVSSKDYKFLPEPLLYLKELIFTLKFIISTQVNWQTYIGMDGLCVFFGSLYKLFHPSLNLIYWVIDFVPHNRFGSSWKNFIYQKINTHGYLHANEVWDLSPRMAEAREEYLHLKKTNYKHIKVVPYGMWVDKIKTIPYPQCESHTLVYMGRIIPSQGLQLVIKSLVKLQLSIPDIKLKIIGDGPYLNDIKKLAQNLKVEKLCTFMGKINDPRELEVEIAKCALAVAPYDKKLDKWTYYADPGKVKTYLACGVPVILTDLPWNAKEIAKHKAGLIFNSTSTDLTQKIVQLLDPHVNQQFRTSAKQYSYNFNYQQIFENLNF